ncbi:hypothetical protein DIPPA_03984 [Diplonema papillatum]|nr:hypothetical protein DIPPA_03984 [Diplonema papillatum]
MGPDGASFLGFGADKVAVDGRTYSKKAKCARSTNHGNGNVSSSPPHFQVHSEAVSSKVWNR